MIIDAKEMLLGRIAARAAKQALLGERVDVVNCELAVVSGSKERLIKDNKRKRNLGTPKGPFYHRSPDRYVRRVIRGMLPHKQPKGRDAFKRVMCHVGIPQEFVGKDTIKVDGAGADKLPNVRFMTVKEICRSMGAK